MRTLRQLFENNRQWAARMERQQPGFFGQLQRQQAPEFLWIGCSDSRVPANEIVGLMPGELFVHRNIANQVIPSDMNCMTVLQYAVEVLRVRHVIVCGHYGCGGVRAALSGQSLGLIDNWLEHIKDLYRRRAGTEVDLSDPDRREDRLCELNVVQQVYNVCHSPFVRAAWDRGQSLAVHGWMYALSDGLLQDMNVCVTGLHELPDA
jgi:carbonic anhydrase